MPLTKRRTKHKQHYGLTPSKSNALPHMTVHGMGMQQQEHSPQSMHGVPAGLVVVVIADDGFMSFNVGG